MGLRRRPDAERRRDQGRGRPPAERFVGLGRRGREEEQGAESPAQQGGQLDGPEGGEPVVGVSAEDAGEPEGETAVGRPVGRGGGRSGRCGGAMSSSPRAAVAGPWSAETGSGRAPSPYPAGSVLVSLGMRGTSAECSGGHECVSNIRSCVTRI